MNRIDRKKLVEIIQKVKKDQNVTYKHFEIFVLAELLEFPALKEYSMVLKRTGDKKRGIVLDHPRMSVCVYFDMEKNEFVYEDGNDLKTGHSIYSQNKMDTIKEIFDLFEKSENYKEFNINFNSFVDKYEKDENLKNLLETADEYKLGANLSLLTSLFFHKIRRDELENDRNYSIRNIYQNIYNALPFSDPIKQVKDILDLKKHVRRNEDFENTREFAGLRDVENFYNIYEERNELTKTKSKVLFENEFVKHNTISGIALNKDLTEEETVFKTLELKYNTVRENFINNYENIIYLKSKEEIESKIPIKDAINEILKEYPELRFQNTGEIKVDIEKGEFAKSESDADKDIYKLMEHINKIGIIDTLIYADLQRFERYIGTMMADSSPSAKKLTISISDDFNVNFNYVFQEVDYFGLNVISPKSIYMNLRTNRSDYEESLKILTEYAITNNLVIYSKSDSHVDSLFYKYENYVEDNYENKVIYIKDDYDSEEKLNCILALQKEFKDFVKYEDLVNFNNKLSKLDYDRDIEDVYKEEQSILSKRFEKVKNKNGPI